MEDKERQLELDFDRQKSGNTGRRPPGTKNMDNSTGSEYLLAIRAASLGLDKGWKKQLVKNLSAGIKVSNILDVQCGTGEIASMLSKKYPEASVTGIDRSKELITRASMINLDENVKFMISDISGENIKDGAYDIVAGGFTLGNSPDLAETLKELKRVMSTGASAGFLELSKTSVKWLQPVQSLLLNLWCRATGFILKNDTGAFLGIARNHAGYPDPVKIRSIIGKTGFRNVRSVKIMSGFAEIILFDN